MTNITELIADGSAFPIEYIVCLIALGALGLAAFTIHVIHAIVKRKDE